MCSLWFSLTNGDIISMEVSNDALVICDSRFGNTKKIREGKKLRRSESLSQPSQ